MPIYDYNGGSHKTKPLAYKDTDNKWSKMSRVVHFGYGDVLVSTAQGRNEGLCDELVFHHTEPRPIGGFEDGRNWATDPPVRFVFDKPESIDVIINMCQKLKTEMLEGSV